MARKRRPNKDTTRQEAASAADEQELVLVDLTDGPPARPSDTMYSKSCSAGKETRSF